jgi:hypothetical protein
LTQKEKCEHSSVNSMTPLNSFIMREREDEKKGREQKIRMDL